MRVLLSAYACEPNRGSEPGVGWNWALELAEFGHDVWVITRANNQLVIESEFAEHAKPSNLNFLYYDLPEWARWWKRGNAGVHLYYILWQWGAYQLAKKVHAEKKFDRVHHVTFVSVRQPSFMGGLGVPFIFGPVAGGESAPYKLRVGYGARGWVIDFLRDVANLLVRFDPLMRGVFKRAEKIYVTSRQTKALIPKKYQHKVHIQLAIGSNDTILKSVSRKKLNTPLKVLYVGHFIYLKGMYLGIRAFAQVVKLVPDARLTMIGEGKEENKWRKLAVELGVADNIDWLPWLPQRELSHCYSENDIFLFPSLHDSGGMVVLEAMAHGLPVISFDLGGPGEVVNETCGIKILTHGAPIEDVVRKIAKAILELTENVELYHSLQSGARVRVKDFNWRNMIRKLSS